MDDETIEAILRHVDYSTTMNSYVLSVRESVQKAVKQCKRVVCTV
ncbi:MAG: hypothetical protein ACRDFW_12405 [bacterium]